MAADGTVTKKAECPRKHTCYRSGCNLPAWAIPVLVVPSSQFSKNKRYAGCRSMIWLPLCRHHFSVQNAREFMNDDVIRGMRASVDLDFIQQHSIPDWANATVQPVWATSVEYVQYEAVWFATQVEGRRDPGERVN